MARILLLLLLTFGSTALAAREVVVYTGRSKALVEPLIQRFTAETGIRVRVRYGRDAQLLALLKAEGGRSPADLFWANTPGALLLAERRGLFAQLPKEVLARPSAFVPEKGDFVPLTLRLRTLAYNPQRVDPGILPRSILDLPRLTAFRGRIGWTPGYSSFQDFVSALRAERGETAARDWLRGMKALAPRAYTGNVAMLLNLASGRIDLALTNHYYVYQLKYGGPEGDFEGEDEEEESPPRGELPLALHPFAPGDPGNLALFTGAGVLKTARHPDAARRLLAFLLAPEAQRFAAQRIHEYPVVAKVRTPAYLGPASRALTLAPRVNFAAFGDLEGTLRLLRSLDLF